MTHSFQILRCTADDACLWIKSGIFRVYIDMILRLHCRRTNEKAVCVCTWFQITLYMLGASQNNPKDLDAIQCFSIDLSHDRELLTIESVVLYIVNLGKGPVKSLMDTV